MCLMSQSPVLLTPMQYKCYISVTVALQNASAASEFEPAAGWRSFATGSSQDCWAAARASSTGTPIATSNGTVSSGLIRVWC